MTILPQKIITPEGFANYTSQGLWSSYRDPSLRSPNFKHHLNVLSQHLMRVAGGHEPFSIITLPPRHGKSELISHYFPAWYLGIFPHHNIINLSYSATLAHKAGEDARNTLKMWGPQLFGTKVDPNHEAKDDWRTTAGGGMLSTGVDGSYTGRNANIVIIDDPVSGDREANSPGQRQAIYDRVTKTIIQRRQPGTSILIVGTRWHRDDLIGRLEKENQSNQRAKHPWKTLRFPAIAETNDPLGRLPGEVLWPEQRPKAFLEEQQARTDPGTWQGAYLCVPPTADGMALWSDDYIHQQHIVTSPPALERIVAKVLSLDPSGGTNAKTGDDSAFCKLYLTDDNFLYVDFDAAIRPPDVLIDTAIQICRDFKPTSFVIETNMSQVFYLKNIDAKAIDMGFNLPLRGVDNRINKEVRIRNTLAPLLTKDPLQSRIRWINTPGTQKCLDQLRDFPNGQHDDLLDSFQMALARMLEMMMGQ